MPSEAESERPRRAHPSPPERSTRRSRAFLGPGGPRFRSWVAPGDLVGGVSAALVLIPQAVAYATLAGMPAQRGLYVATLAPLAAALVASSPYLSTGPTAIASLLTFGGLVALAEPESARYVELAALLAVLVGAIRVGLGAARGGVIAYLLSQPVIVGFTTGAGVVIVATQVPTMLGMEATGDNPFAVALTALARPARWNLLAIGLAIACMAIISVGKRIHRLFPGILVAGALALAVGAATSYDGPVVGTITGGLPPVSLALPWSSFEELLLPAFVIAVVGFSEPAAIARRYAVIDRRRWDPNRELVSQGIANVAAGIGGGFPAGGSFSRSALVRNAGGRSRLSGAITGLVVLACLPFTSVLDRLPTAMLAAAIIMAVVELIDVRPFERYQRYARLQSAVAVVTFATTIALAPHVEWGIIVGVGCAVCAHLWRELRLTIPSWTRSETLHLAPKGVLYFASAPGLEIAFTRLLHEHPEANRLVVHLDGLGRIDLTGALALDGLLRDAREAGLSTDLVGVPPPARKIVDRVIRSGGGGDDRPP